MATSTMWLLALLLCCVALSSTSGSAIDWVDLGDEPNPKSMNLTEFWWTRNHLRVCTDKNLKIASESKGLLVTIIISKGKAEWNFEGKLDGKMSNCAKFEFLENPLSATEQSYALVIQKGSTAMRGYAKFAAPVDRAISITCGGHYSPTPLTRLSGKEDMTAIVEECLPFKPENGTVCYTTSAVRNQDETVCYHEENSVPKSLMICLDMDEGKPDGGVTIDYLEYSGTGGTEGAVTLALSDPVTDVLVQRDGAIITCYDCTDRYCQLTGVGPSTSTYSVCAVTVRNDDATTTATDTITDLDMIMYRDSMGLEFRFTNSQPGNYSAALSKSPLIKEGLLPITTLVCSNIHMEGQCYGLLLTPNAAELGPVYFVLQYNVNDSNPNKVNKIVAPPYMTM